MIQFGSYPSCDLWHYKSFRKGSWPVSLHRTGYSSGDNSRSTPDDRILRLQSHRIAVRSHGCTGCRTAVTVFNSADYWLPVSSLGLRDLRCRDDDYILLTITGYRGEKPKIVSQKRVIGVQRSRGIVAKLAGLFALDAFAGGFIVQSIVAYWFYLRYETDLNTLGGIFFGNESSGRSLLPRRACDRPAFRTPKHYGLHTPAVEHFTAAGAFDAQSGACRCNAARKKLTLPARRTDPPIVYDGSRRR